MLIAGWSKNDQAAAEGLQTESLTFAYGLAPILEPTHILPTSSSFNDLIIINQPNLVIESGVHASLHSNCRHQIFLKYKTLKYYILPHPNA